MYLASPKHLNVLRRTNTLLIILDYPPKHNALFLSFIEFAYAPPRDISGSGGCGGSTTIVMPHGIIGEATLSLKPWLGVGIVWGSNLLGDDGMRLATHHANATD